MERATRETWAKRVGDWKRSGLTAEEYAARTEVKASTLLWWSSQLNRSALTRVSAAPPVVEVVLASRQSVGLEVALPSGARVAVPVGFDGPTLARLLSVLEGG
jgi:transposase